ncbi:MAG: hypothetical protein AAF985_08465 [Bacteroidota bacterium]
MKNLLYFFSMLVLVSLVACGDEEPVVMTPEYSINIVSPNTDNKSVGESMPLEVNIKESNGMTVHHVNVKVYNRDDASEVIYDGPSEAHVHEEDGDYTLTDNIQLDVAGHSNWVVEVKVWGHEAGAAEKTETLEFHVHPNHPNYVIDVQSPTTDDKNVGDEVDINVNFKDMHGGTVHHIKVLIYNKADNTQVIYDGPADAHVHEEDGDYTYTDKLDLAVDAHTDWIVEVKAWGHEAGAHEKVETVEFHVHPQ